MAQKRLKALVRTLCILPTLRHCIFHYRASLTHPAQGGCQARMVGDLSEGLRQTQAATHRGTRTRSPYLRQRVYPSDQRFHFATALSKVSFMKRIITKWSIRSSISPGRSYLLEESTLPPSSNPSASSSAFASYTVALTASSSYFRRTTPLFSSSSTSM
jgi:hypothetical protein